MRSLLKGLLTAVILSSHCMKLWELRNKDWGWGVMEEELQLEWFGFKYK